MKWCVVMWSDVMWFKVKWCDVMWCDGMWCGVCVCVYIWCAQASANRGTSPSINATWRAGSVRTSKWQWNYVAWACITSFKHRYTGSTGRLLQRFVFTYKKKTNNICSRQWTPQYIMLINTTWWLNQVRISIFYILPLFFVANSVYFGSCNKRQENAKYISSF